MEVLGPAIGVGTADAGHAFGVVATLKKTQDRLGDPLQAGVAQSAGIQSVVESGKLGEVAAEKPLQRAGTPLPVGVRGCGLRLEGQRVGHSID